MRTVPDFMRTVALCVLAYTVAQQVDASTLPPVAKEWVLGTNESPQLIAIRPDNHREEVLYSESHALLIGETNYSNGFGKLSDVNDEMLRLGKALRSHNFHVLYYADVRSDQLIDVLKDFAERYGHIRKARIVIYLSGHGETLEDELDESEPPKKNLIGYFAPVDAPTKEDSEDEFRKKAIRLSEIVEQVQSMTALHVLVLLDSCCSGAIFQAVKSSGLPETSRLLPPTAVFTKPSTNRVRMFISAGSASDRGPSPSNFAAYFTDTLNGGHRDDLADRNGDEFLTGTEFFSLVKAKLPREASGPTSPQMGYGNIIGAWENGDIAFKLSVPGVLSPSSDLVVAANEASESRDIVEDYFVAESACDDCGESEATETEITLQVPKDRVGFFREAKLDCKGSNRKFSVIVRGPKILADGQTCTATVKTWGGKKATWYMRADIQPGVYTLTSKELALQGWSTAPLPSAPVLAQPRDSATTKSLNLNVGARDQSSLDVVLPTVSPPTPHPKSDAVTLDIKAFTLQWKSRTYDLRRKLEADNEKSRSSAREELADILAETNPNDVGTLIDAMPNTSYRYAIGLSEALGKVKSGWTTPDVKASIQTLDYVASQQKDQTLFDSVERAKRNVKMPKSQ